jgi:catalase (peroxidase I)
MGKRNSGAEPVSRKHAPSTGTQTNGPTNRDWWPNKLDLRALRQNFPLSDLWARSSIMPRASVSRATH